MQSHEDQQGSPPQSFEINFDTVLTIEHPSDQECVASLNSRPCQTCTLCEGSCWESPCPNSITADCTNIDSEYRSITVCPPTATEGESESNANPFVVIPLTFVIFCLLRSPFRLRCRTPLRHYDRVSTGNRNGRTGHGRRTWVELPQRGGVVAKEAVQDRHAYFDFFNPISGDPIATELIQQCDREDWQALRDYLTSLRPIENDNSESANVTAKFPRESSNDDIGVELKKLPNGTFTIFRLSSEAMQGNGLAVGMSVESINGTAIDGMASWTCKSLLCSSVGEIVIVASRNRFDMTQDNTRSFYFTAVGAHLTKVRNDELQGSSCCSLLDSWVKAEPDQADCHILRAIVFIKRAMQSRSEPRFQEFMRLATIEMQSARELCPSDPLVYGEALPVGLGLGSQCGNRIEATSCLADLSNLTPDPLHYTAHIRALQYYCKKKHGSHVRMFSFARQTTGELPSCHPLWVLIPMAHYEYVFYERNESHWTRPDVVEEMLSAYQKAFPGQAETSIQATETPSISQEWTSRNYFAYCLIATGLLGEARRQIRLIGKRPIPLHPWRLMKNYLQAIETLGFETRVDSEACTPEEAVTDHAIHPDATDQAVHRTAAVAHAEIVSNVIDQEHTHQSPIEAEAVAIAMNGESGGAHVDAGEAVVVHIV